MKFSLQIHRLRTFVLFPCVLLLLSMRAAQAQPTPGQLLETIAGSYYARGAFNGVVLVAQRDKILYRRGFGPADREHKIANAPDTPYPICSITKQFTALLVMQLVEAGRVRLDVPVTEYLPDFRAGKNDGITLRQLLVHTSGLPNLDDALPEQNGVPGFYLQADPKFSDAAFVTKTYCSGPLLSKPGERFSYNNADYWVLQAVLERVSGQPYAQLLQEKILRPLKMQHTGLIVQDTFAPRQAAGYVKPPKAKSADGKEIEEANGAKPTLIAEPNIHFANYGAAGAMYSTADDLLKWDRALDSDRLLSKTYREIMFTPLPSTGYGALGSWVFRPNLSGAKPLVIDREGDIEAFTMCNLRLPDDGYSVIILCNTETSDLGAVYMGRGLAYDLLRALYSTLTPADQKVAP